MPEAIKSQPRESYYLEITVDRVGGDHMHAALTRNSTINL